MPIRIGILGCARIAKAAVIDAAGNQSGLVVAGIASRSAGKAAAFARQHGIATTFSSYAGLLADPGIDAVYVPLPNSLHAEWTIAALEAGKAVLCEKPMASNSAEAARMVHVANDTGRPLMEAFHYRYHPMMGYILEVLRTGTLGRLQSVRASLKIPEGLAAADDIRFQSGLSGGAMMDVGAYCMNALRYVTDGEPGVESASAKLVAPDVDGEMKVRLCFPSGTIGEIDCSLVAPDFEARLDIVGEHGRLEARNPFLPHLGNAVTLTVHGKTSRLSFDRTPTYTFQARAFASLIRGESASLSTPEDGMANMLAIDRTYEAAGLPPRG